MPFIIDFFYFSKSTLKIDEINQGLISKIINVTL
jgi:hypothetical protein